MHELSDTRISCPYCGELIEVLVDSTDTDQQYIEDCQVCCRPITFVISSGAGGELNVAVYSENDTY